jgi:hypothetical protein
MLTDQQAAELRSAIEKLPDDAKENHAWQELCGGQPSAELLQHVLYLRKNPVLREMLRRADEALDQQPELERLAPPQLFRQVWPEAIRREDFRDLFVQVRRARRQRQAED